MGPKNVTRVNEFISSPLLVHSFFSSLLVSVGKFNGGAFSFTLKWKTKVIPECARRHGQDWIQIFVWVAAIYIWYNNTAKEQTSRRLSLHVLLHKYKENSSNKKRPSSDVESSSAGKEVGLTDCSNSERWIIRWVEEARLSVYTKWFLQQTVFPMNVNKMTNQLFVIKLSFMLTIIHSMHTHPSCYIR